MNVETAQRLANLRRSKGYSQEGLARKLGLSRQAVSKWERAESSPDTENLISLAKLYGVSLDDLLNPSDEIEDDIEFENEDRARQREEEATEHARTHEAAASGQGGAGGKLERAGCQCRHGASDERHGQPDAGKGPVSIFSVLGRLLAAVLFADVPVGWLPLCRADLLYDSYLPLGGACARWRLGTGGYSGWSGTDGGPGSDAGRFRRG